MTNTLIGYARCSTDKHNLAAQKEVVLQFFIIAELCAGHCE